MLPQVGAALANEELNEDLRARTEELERLQARMVHQHEEQRARLWRELQALKRPGRHFRRQAPIGPFVVDIVQALACQLPRRGRP